MVSNTGAVTPFKKPTFNRNQFGMNFSGPIIKDKLFFFLDYEGFRQTVRPLSVLTLPTQNELNGILVVPVKDPTTGVVYPANTPVPAGAINPLSQQIISHFKTFENQLPVAGLPATGLASNDYAVQAPFTDNSDKGDLRIGRTRAVHGSCALAIQHRGRLCTVGLQPAHS